MPIYEYRCSSCGHQQEFLQRVSDAPLTVCTRCGKPGFSKLLSAAGFQLKGSGWYATDFKSGGSAPAKGESGDAKAEGGKSGDGKSGDGKSGGGESKACGAGACPACA